MALVGIITVRAELASLSFLFIPSTYILPYPFPAVLTWDGCWEGELHSIV